MRNVFNFCVALTQNKCKHAYSTYTDIQRDSYRCLLYLWGKKALTFPLNSTRLVWTGGALNISLGGEVCPAPYTLTLFKTKVTDFPTLFKTEFQFLIPCLRHLTRNHTLSKTIINTKF